MKPLAKPAASALVAIVSAGCAAAEPASRPPPEASRMSPAPRRIVSLVPAATEILFDLGAGNRIVGRTRWGIHPPPARRIPDVGDGVRPSVEAVVARDPDLVILYQGPTNRETQDRLAGLGVPTLALRHDSFADLRRNILRLGELVDCVEGALALVDRIASGLAAVSEATAGLRRVRVYYDAWAVPPVTVGRGSFIDSLLTVAGTTNIFGDLDAASPRVSLEAIIERDPEHILVAVPPETLDRPPDLADRHGWTRIPAVTAGRIAVADRDLVTRLGPRVADAAWAIADAIHAGLPVPSLPATAPPCRS